MKSFNILILFLSLILHRHVHCGYKSQRDFSRAEMRNLMAQAPTEEENDPDVDFEREDYPESGLSNEPYVEQIPSVVYTYNSMPDNGLSGGAGASHLAKLVKTGSYRINRKRHIGALARNNALPFDVSKHERTNIRSPSNGLRLPYQTRSAPYTWVWRMGSRFSKKSLASLAKSNGLPFDASKYKNSKSSVADKSSHRMAPVLLGDAYDID